MALVGTETIPYETASGSQISVGGATAGAIAALAAALPARVNTPISTAGAGVLTAAALIGSVITRSGCVSNFTDTTDTAANIIAALASGAPINTAWLVEIRNTNPVVQTISAGAGVTLSGESIIPANGVGQFLLVYSSSSAVLMIGIGVHYNSPGKDPATAVSAFGGGTGTLVRSGNLYREVDASGVNPGGTGADNVIAVYSIPASSFDQALRGLRISAKGSFAANGNNKRLKIIFNPSTAVLGSTVGSGGTVVTDTGTLTTSGGGWSLSGEVYKYGAAGSNTQLTTPGPTAPPATAVAAPALATATESGAILIAVTGNAGTTATDITLNQFTVEAFD